MYGVTLASIARASFCAYPKVFWHVEAAVDHNAATVVGILGRQGTGNSHKMREIERNVRKQAKREKICCEYAEVF